MRILITGICGFVGSSLARRLLAEKEDLKIFGIDNLIRPGSEQNRQEMRRLGIQMIHGDVRCASDFENLPVVDWVIDAAANPSVLAGVDGKTSSRQLLEHNLYGTVNILEYCRANRAGFVLLSTSRVYSIPPLAGLPVEVHDRAFRLNPGAACPEGVSIEGVSEAFSTAPPVSLYGCTKLASELLALEYGETFGLPVWINRCGVLAGAGQFGRADQGIFSFWIHSWLAKKPLKYIGFSGSGHQVRDCLHPHDLVSLLLKQMNSTASSLQRIQNLSGGRKNSMSLLQLSDWCRDRLGAHQVESDLTPRPFDIPWMVLDSRLAKTQWEWEPATSLETILEELAAHAHEHPSWLDLSAP